MRSFFLLLALMLLCGGASSAQAASIAYIDNGEVWLSSLDGASKVRLAAPVVNPSGATEKWIDVAQADNGRIVAVRVEPGKTSRLGWFKVFEPNGTSTVEGPLNSPGGWLVYVYPLGFDLTADGGHMVYGYSNSSGCCPISFAHGTYVRPVSNSPLDPIALSGWEYPSIVGNRVIARSGATVHVQDATATTYGTTFKPWLDTSGVGLDLRRTDVAANGRLMAIELEQWNGGGQTVGKIAVVAAQGIDATPTFPAAVDCFLPATGIAREPSLSQDASQIVWTDGGGLKVAGTPVDANDPCVLRSTPVTISATGSHGSIGGAEVSAFLPAGGGGGPGPGGGGGSAPSAGGNGGPGPAGGGGTAPTPPAAPVLSLPAKVALKAAGFSVPVTVSAAGKVTLTATVPAKAMGRKGKPVAIGTGSATAAGAGRVIVKLRLTGAAKKRLKRLKGVKMTLTLRFGGRTSTKTVTLR
jgi:hypothetical protein